MPENTSFFTKVVQEVAGELVTLRKNTKEGIPLMKKSVTRRDAQNRIHAMSPEQRQQFIDKNGIDEVMRILGDDLPPIPTQAPQPGTLPLNIG
jgi:hypothetical protein